MTLMYLVRLSAFTNGMHKYYELVDYLEGAGLGMHTRDRVHSQFPRSPPPSPS